MNTFTLSKDKEYLIYGAGGDGIKTIELLNRMKRKVVAVIDKRSNEIENFKDIPVVSPNELDDFAGKTNIVCIITVKNVFSHTEIAQSLKEKGIRRLIYKPFKVLQGVSGEWEKIDKAYEEIVTKGCIDEDGTIPILEDDEPIEFRDVLQKSRKERKTTVYLPTELLCNYDKDIAWGRFPMYSFFPIVELYKYLLDGDGSWEEVQNNYLIYCGSYLNDNALRMTDGQRKSFISSRVNVFYEMQKKYDRMHSFFEENAPTVSYDGEMRFYLNTSGRNRVCYQIARGANYIPVCMDDSSYDQWMNRSGFDEFKNYLIQNKIFELFTMVPHPFFQEFPCIATDYSRIFCEYIVKDIMKYVCKQALIQQESYFMLGRSLFEDKLSEIQVAMLLNDNGTLSRCLKIAHISNVRLYTEKNMNDKEISNRLNRLFHMEQQEKLTALEHSQSANILVVDSEICSSCQELNLEGVSFIYFYSHRGSAGVENFVKGTSYKSMLQFGFEVWKGTEVQGYRIEV